MSDKEVKKAKEVLERISEDKDARYLAELREKYIRDQKAIEGAGYDKGLDEGIKKGIAQGIEQGMAQGKRNNTLELAKKMKEQGLDIEMIQKITNLTKEEINNL